MSGLIQARWVAGFPVDLPDGTSLKPGDTYQVPEGEAKASDHWEPVKAGKQTAPAVPEEGEQ